MTCGDGPVRLVRLGYATAAAVCDDDRCHLPESTVDSLVGPPRPGRADRATDDEDDHGAA